MFFFFSSRRRHTRCSRDWSSDVCSSDLKFSGSSTSGRDSRCGRSVGEAGRKPGKLFSGINLARRGESRTYCLGARSKWIRISEGDNSLALENRCGGNGSFLAHGFEFRFRVGKALETTAFIHPEVNGSAFGCDNNVVQSLGVALQFDCFRPAFFDSQDGGPGFLGNKRAESLLGHRGQFESVDEELVMVDHTGGVHHDHISRQIEVPVIFLTGHSAVTTFGRGGTEVYFEAGRLRALFTPLVREGLKMSVGYEGGEGL